MGNKKVVIMRGPSGSGKSTYIKRHLSDAYVCSADHYFHGEDGSYNFDARLLGKAHDACFKKFKQALRDGKDLVVVDNTNTRIREFKRYVQAAKHAGFDVELVRMETPTSVAAARNVHNVPEDAVKRMAGRMQDAPEDWRETVVSGVDE